MLLLLNVVTRVIIVRLHADRGNKLKIGSILFEYRDDDRVFERTCRGKLIIPIVNLPIHFKRKTSPR